MSLILEAAIERAAEKVLKEFLTDNVAYNAETLYKNSGVLGFKVLRRTPKMSWMDFSDAELRIVNEVEKNPGMKQNAIISLMSVHDDAYPDGTPDAGTVRFLLANLVKRKVLIASSTNGYTINDSDYPPAKKYPDR
jgi:hypothetical protein